MAIKTNLKIRWLISVLLLAVMSVNLRAAGTYSGGDGSQGNPYKIADANDMNEIGGHPNDWDKHFILTADINLADYTGTQFNIIGYYVDYSNNKPFTGVFDGNGHAISNFTYECNDSDCIGLFGYIKHANAEIKDLTLTGPNVHAAGYSGYVGSLVGRLKYGTVTACGVEAGSVSEYYCTGALVGHSYYGSISNCYATASVWGTSRYTGGLVGDNYGGSISSCYATGAVSGTSYAGGLVGHTYSGMISNCYATGSVSGSSDIGGLVGYHDGGSYTSCFWDIDVNPDVNGIGNIADPPDVMARTTAQMQTQSTFTDYGWDFVGETVNGPNDIWRMCIDGV